MARCALVLDIVDLEEQNQCVCLKGIRRGQTFEEQFIRAPLLCLRPCRPPTHLGELIVKVQFFHDGIAFSGLQRWETRNQLVWKKKQPHRRVPSKLSLRLGSLKLLSELLEADAERDVHAAALRT
ncbi:unnamed protein product [Arctogadus glacialis]